MPGEYVQVEWNDALAVELVESIPESAHIIATTAAAERARAHINDQYRGWGTGRLAADVGRPKMLPSGEPDVHVAFIGSSLPYARVEDEGSDGLPGGVIRAKAAGGYLYLKTPARGGMVTGRGALENHPAFRNANTPSGPRMYQKRTVFAKVKEVQHPAKNFLAEAAVAYEEVMLAELAARLPK